MATKLIETNDGILIEVDASGSEGRAISGGVELVDASINKIKGILVKTSAPVVEAWRELNKEMHVDSAEIEIGLSFEGEGNLYIAKSKAGANLKVKLTLKPKSNPDASKV